MRILLDEDVPRRLALRLPGYEVTTVQRRGWTGIKNGILLSLASAEFDLLLTMDSNIEYQQNLDTLPISVLIIEATSNRMEQLDPLIPRILAALDQIRARVVRRIKS